MAKDQADNEQNIKGTEKPQPLADNDQNNEGTEKPQSPTDNEQNEQSKTTVGLIGPVPYTDSEQNAKPQPPTDNEQNIKGTEKPQPLADNDQNNEGTEKPQSPTDNEQNIEDISKPQPVTDNIGPVSFTVTPEDDGPHLSVGYKGTFKHEGLTVGVSGQIQDANIDPTYSESITFNGSTDSTDLSITAQNDSNNNYQLQLGLKKNYLMNPNNPMNTQNQDQERQKELVSTGERFNLQAEVGNSNEGFYTKNSLMYRFNDKNFLKTDYTKSHNVKGFSLSANLSSVNIDYSNNTSENENIKTRQNNASVMLKGKKNQYSLSALNTQNPTENTTSIVAGAKLNRTQFGEFESGLNGEIKTAISFGSQHGFNVNLDGAYNWYGAEHDSDKDYLLSSQVSFGNTSGIKNFEANLLGAYRINNCNTIFQPGVGYSSTHGNGEKNNVFGTSLGVFQNVGKNFGDTVIYAKTKLDYSVKDANNETTNSTNFNITTGVKQKPTKNLTLYGETSYSIQDGFNGNVGVRYTF